MQEQTKDIEKLRELYPYWTFPAAEALLERSDSMSESQRSQLKQYVASLTGDPDALRRIVGTMPEPADFDSAPVESPTDAVIDSFLGKFGTGRTPRSDEADERELQRMLGVPTMDYAATLETQSASDPEPAPKPTPVETEKTIAAPEPTPDVAEPTPVEAKPTPDVTPVEAEKPTVATDSPQDQKLTESLVFTLVKNGNYVKALEIINQLCLNNPEKSVYFADQIRFLRKVIAIKNL